MKQLYWYAMNPEKPLHNELSRQHHKSLHLVIPTSRCNRLKVRNVSLLSIASLSTIACNSATDDQCYGGLGIIAGAFCASQNDVSTNTQVALTNVSSTGNYELTTALDENGQARSDTVEFTRSGNVIGTKYTLTSGDILKNPGKVSLNLVNSGALDGQNVFGADEIEVKTQGTTVILASKWVNNETITIKNSDKSVTLNNLQSSQLDSAKAEDNNFYPGTIYKIANVAAPNETISYYFNEAAILGTSTELQLSVKDSQVGLQAGVFVDPGAANAAVEAANADPFAIAPDTNIETLNLIIDDTEGSGSKITDIVYSGLKTLHLSGGIDNNTFEILNPLDATLTEISASSVPADLKLNLSESVSKKIINLGSGNDTISVGGALVASPQSDIINAGSGSDTLIVNFADAVTVAPTLSSIEELRLQFNGASVLDMSNTSDVSVLNFLVSTAGVTLRGVPFDLSNLNISESQAGVWTISYEDNAAATPNLVWSNDTPAAVALTSLNFDEIKSFSLTVDGANDLTVTSLALDPDDTTLVSLMNTDDGNLSISAGGQVSTLDALTSISLTSTEGGNIVLGSASGGFGISDAPKLSSIALTASQTGKIELGTIGSAVAAEDLQTISIITSGADVALGNITASKVGTLTASVSSSATVSLGTLSFVTSGSSLTVNGSGSLSPVTFSNEAYKNINLTDLVSGTSVSFANAKNPVTLSAGSGDDTVVFGLGADTITGNDGNDIFVVGNGATGITLSTADVITDFQTGADKLKLGVLGDGTAGTGNYVEGASSVSNYGAALAAANLALTALNGTSAATELYAFQHDSNAGYLFIDTDSDGSAEDMIILTGTEKDTISATDIIA